MDQGVLPRLPEKPVLVYSQHGPFQLDKMVVCLDVLNFRVVILQLLAYV